jgi:hypothetical protein
VLGKVSRLIVSASVAAVLVGCNSLGMGGGESKAAPAQPAARADHAAGARQSLFEQSLHRHGDDASGTTAQVVQGACPRST